MPHSTECLPVDRVALQIARKRSQFHIRRHNHVLCRSIIAGRSVIVPAELGNAFMLHMGLHVDVTFVIVVLTMAWKEALHSHLRVVQDRLVDLAISPPMNQTVQLEVFEIKLSRNEARRWRNKKQTRLRIRRQRRRETASHDDECDKDYYGNDGNRGQRYHDRPDAIVSIRKLIFYNMKTLSGKYLIAFNSGKNLPCNYIQNTYVNT